MAQSASIVPAATTATIGRPTLCTPELTQGICDLIRKGNRPAEAAGCFGVDTSSFHLWMKRGRNREPRYSDFYEQVTRAKNDAKEGLVALIRAAALSDPKNWKAAAHVLERLDPKPAASVAPSSLPTPAQLTDEGFWQRFEKDTMERLALLEERKRVLRERGEQQSAPDHALLSVTAREKPDK